MKGNKNQQLPASEAFFSFLKALGILLMAFLVSNLVASIFVLPLVNFDLGVLKEIRANPFQKEGFKLVLLIFQGIMNLVTFTAGALMYFRLEKNDNLGRLNDYEDIPVKPVMLTILLVIGFMPLNSYIIHWNSSLDFPAFMEGFEQWAREREAFAQKLTQFLTNFNTFGGFTIGLIVMGIIPAVGEELVFRGIIQRRFEDMTGNAHLAIWITAILFSSIHIQFFGFIPRMLLGAMFGYLYVWSGNIGLPIMAHFVNNSFTLLMMYMYQKGMVGFNIDSKEAMSVQSVIFSIILSVVLILYFRDYYLYRRTDLN